MAFYQSWTSSFVFRGANLHYMAAPCASDTLSCSDLFLATAPSSGHFCWLIVNFQHQPGPSSAPSKSGGSQCLVGSNSSFFCTCSVLPAYLLCCHLHALQYFLHTHTHNNQCPGVGPFLLRWFQHNL